MAGGIPSAVRLITSRVAREPGVVGYRRILLDDCENDHLSKQ